MKRKQQVNFDEKSIDPELLNQYRQKEYIGPFLQNVVTKGVVLRRSPSMRMPRGTMAYAFFGNLAQSDHASPLTISIILPIKFTVRFFSGFKFITAGSTFPQISYAGILSLSEECSRHLGFVFAPVSATITNILFTSYVQWTLDLDKLKKLLAGKVVDYAPNLFPALRYKYLLPEENRRLTASIFSSGAINITGGKDTSDGEKVIDHLLPLLRQCKVKPVDQISAKVNRWEGFNRNMQDKRRKSTGTQSVTLGTQPSLYYRRGNKPVSITNVSDY